MDDPDTRIVAGLKDPWKFLFVDMDIAMLALPVAMGLMLVGLSILPAGAGAVGVAYALHAVRKGRPKGYARHFAYWHLPPIATQLSRVPPNWAPRTLG